jgi:hypothetical protein
MDERRIDAFNRGDIDSMNKLCADLLDRIEDLEDLVVEDRSKLISTFSSDIRRDMNDVWKSMDVDERLEQRNLAEAELIGEKVIE